MQKERIRMQARGGGGGAFARAPPPPPPFRCVFAGAEEK